MKRFMPTIGRVLALSGRCAVPLAGLMPWPAHAHLVSTGLGPFYDGMGHFALGLEGWLPMLALALLAGLQGPAHGRRLLVVLPLTWLLAAGLSAQFRWTPSALTPVMNGLPALMMLLLGALAAAAPRLGVGAMTVLGLALGGVLGGLDGAGLAGRSEVGRLLAGNFTALLLALMLMLGLATLLARNADWRRIAVRALGSWVAAAGLLLLGWQLR